MISRGRVIILESILIDKNLPKYKVVKKPKNENEGENNSGFIDFGGTMVSGSDIVPFDNSTTSGDNRYDQLEYYVEMNPSFKNRFKFWFYKKFYYEGRQKQKVPKISLTSLVNFFDEVKDGMSKIDSKHIDTVINRYETVLENAQNNNQTALVEKIEDYASVLKQELVLATSDFNRYLTEEDLVKFHDKASVHEKFNTCLRLTYVKNFIKVIPNEVTDLKEKADELKVFDNYVVLHYDYEGDSVADTKEEIERKKDPVLFGVIKGSKNLYYIGDWIDEYCDLTLDKIIKAIGEDKRLSAKDVQENLLEGIK